MLTRVSLTRTDNRYDLAIDTDAETRLTCARHGVTVVYSAQLPTDEAAEP